MLLHRDWRDIVVVIVVVSCPLNCVLFWWMLCSGKTCICSCWSRSTLFELRAESSIFVASLRLSHAEELQFECEIVLFFVVLVLLCASFVLTSTVDLAYMIVGALLRWQLPWIALGFRASQQKTSYMNDFDMLCEKLYIYCVLVIYNVYRRHFDCRQMNDVDICLCAALTFEGISAE